MEIKPTPIIKGKAAKDFHNEINKGKITKEQKKFLRDCKKKRQELMNG